LRVLVRGADEFEDFGVGHDAVGLFGGGEEAIDEVVKA